MRSLARLSAAALIAAAAAGCAAGPGTLPGPGGAAAPGSSGAAGIPAVAPADTAGAAAADLWFLEIHADLVRTIARLERSAPGDPRLVETEAIMKTAEECFLEGRTLIAIRLLTEAEELLRTDP